MFQLVQMMKRRPRRKVLSDESCLSASYRNHGPNRECTAVTLHFHGDDDINRYEVVLDREAMLAMRDQINRSLKG